MKVYAIERKDFLMGREQSLYYDFSAHEWHVLNGTVCSQFTRERRQAEHYQSMYEGSSIIECDLVISVNT